MDKKETVKEKEVSQEDLQKTLDQLEGKKEEETKEVEKEVVPAAKIEKTGDKIQATATHELRKAIEVSSVLKEAVQVMGLHVDESLETLNKSITAAANRDLAMIRVMEGLKKSVDELKETMAEYGKGTDAKPKTQTDKTQVLQKTGDEGQQTGGQKQYSKGQIAQVMLGLAKSAGPGTDEGRRWSNAIAIYETSGQINNKDLMEVRKELAKLG